MADRYTLTRAQQDALIAYALSHITTNGNGHAAPKAKAPWGTLRKAKNPGPKSVSPKVRSALSRAMSKRWAEVRKAGKTTLQN